jgi:hypothetical protein
MLPDRLREQFPPATQDHIQICRPNRMQTIILKIQIDDPPPVDTLRHKFLDGIKEQKRLT